MDFWEFVKLMTTRNQFLMDDDDMKEAFRIFDRDNRGYIMSSELRYLQQRLYRALKIPVLITVTNYCSQSFSGCL